MGIRNNILFITNCIPIPIRDGQTRRTFHILKGLSKNYDIYLLSLFGSDEESYKNNLDVLEKYCKEIILVPGPKKNFSILMLFRLIRSVFSKDPYTIWRHYSREFLDRLRGVLQEKRIDLVHCDILPMAYISDTIRTYPCSLTDHDVSFLKAYRMAMQASNPLLKWFLYFEAAKLKRLEKNIFDDFTVGIAVSEVDGKILQDLGGKKNIRIVENGVDTEEFQPSPERVEENSLLWLGGFVHYPNREAMHYFLEKIYPTIKRQVQNVKITLIGGGVTETIRRHSERDPSILLKGYVDDPIPHIWRSAVVVVPLLSGSGTRLKILEAMSVGKAVVSTSLGVEGIHANAGEHLLIADEPEEFAMCVVRLLNDPGFREKIGENARRLAVETYDWTGLTEKLDGIYQDVLRGHVIS